MFTLMQCSYYFRNSNEKTFKDESIGKIVLKRIIMCNNFTAVIAS